MKKYKFGLIGIFLLSGFLLGPSFVAADIFYRVPSFGLGPGVWTSIHFQYSEGDIVIIQWFVPMGSGDTLDVMVLEEENYNLLYLVLTHGHADHIAGLEEIDCPFYIHPQDKGFLKDPLLNLSCLFSPFTIDKEPRLIEENDRLFLDSYILEVLHTPGHTPGSISLKLDCFLFAGDTLFSGSVGRTDFPYASGELLLASIKEKIFPLGENTLIFPGHGESTSLKREIDNNPFFK